MIINGVRVSRDALTGDPGFPGGSLLRMANRPAIPSRNSVTATHAIVQTQKRGFLSRLGGAVSSLGAAAIAGPVGLAFGLGPSLHRALPTSLRRLTGAPFAGLGVDAFGRPMGRRRRRMRPTNIRALRRALSRVRSFERIARRVIRVTPRFHRRIHGRGTRGVRRRRAA